MFGAWDLGLAPFPQWDFQGLGLKALLVVLSGELATDTFLSRPQATEQNARGLEFSPGHGPNPTCRHPSASLIATTPST